MPFVGRLAIVGRVEPDIQPPSTTGLPLRSGSCAGPRHRPFRGVDDLDLATLSWVHWFNHDRLHAASATRPPSSTRTTTTLLPTPPDRDPCRDKLPSTEPRALHLRLDATWAWARTLALGFTRLRAAFT